MRSAGELKADCLVHLLFCFIKRLLSLKGSQDVVKDEDLPYEDESSV